MLPKTVIVFAQFRAADGPVCCQRDKLVEVLAGQAARSQVYITSWERIV